MHGDVFRAPRKGMLLSVFLGNGTQIFFMACITLVFACLGFLSPANRGALMTCSIVLWVCLGAPAGYVSARIYKSKFRLSSQRLKSELYCYFFYCCVLQCSEARNGRATFFLRLSSVQGLSNFFLFEMFNFKFCSCDFFIILVR